MFLLVHFLSGVDSSIVVAAANRVNQKEKLKTFCIGFDEYDYNEISKSKFVHLYLRMKTL